MEEINTYQPRLKILKCCFIVPTFNNEKTLTRVIGDLLNYTTDIIVINDGSTDGTSKILEQFELLQIINFNENKGKGAALKEGFIAAERLGFQNAISIDSDGQLFAEDIPVFVEALESNQSLKPLILIGERMMDDHTIPKKSIIGNQFSSFSFWLQTGIKLKDTQCGYRLYPLKLVNRLQLRSSRYELEIEVIVKAAWAGAQIANIPVKVVYDEKERVTHFKPWLDTFRIINLNFKLAIERLFNNYSK